jgi:hypothetical protein
MKLRVQLFKRIISTVITVTILAAPVAAASGSKGAEEKKEPGALAKVFSTHPATGDRIEKARLLLTRFPERDEYTVSTSEFDMVKHRLLSLINQQGLDKTDKAPPTLKRKPSRGDSNAGESESDKAPPTLKRKPGSGADND